jgi:hypothetical protein
MMISEPKLGLRKVLVTERRTKIEFAQTMQHIVDMYPDADVISVVLDNLNTHKTAPCTKPSRRSRPARSPGNSNSTTRPNMAVG